MGGLVGRITSVIHKGLNLTNDPIGKCFFSSVHCAKSLPLSSSPANGYINDAAGHDARTLKTSTHQSAGRKGSDLTGHCADLGGSGRALSVDGVGEGIAVAKRLASGRA